MLYWICVEWWDSCRIGYTYNKRNLGYIGASASYHKGKLNYSYLFHVGRGVGVYGGSFRGKFECIPAEYFNVGLDIVNTKTIILKHFINPTIELSVLNFAKLNVGYSVPFESLNGVQMKGFAVSLTFSIGTQGYYLDPSS